MVKKTCCWDLHVDPPGSSTLKPELTHTHTLLYDTHTHTHMQSMCIYIYIHIFIFIYPHAKTGKADSEKRTCGKIWRLQQLGRLAIASASTRQPKESPDLQMEHGSAVYG